MLSDRAPVETGPGPSRAAAAEAGELAHALVRAAQSGDAAARRTFVITYQDRVFRLLRRMLSPSGVGAATIEDLAQETFLHAFASLPRFDPQASARLSTWLLTIATRRAIDALRVAARRPAAVVVTDAIADDAAPFGRPEDRLLAGRLCSAMAELSADQRAVFVLREYHGMDYDEIARALDLSPGTVASRLSRARSALERILGGDEP